MHKIPKSLIKDIVTLTNHRNQHIFILGTCHISLKSCNDTKLLIQSINPKVVFIELCEQRKDLLFNPDIIKQQNNINSKEIIKKLINGELNLFGLTYSYILRNITSNLEMQPGNEFKVAYDTALSTNSSVVLGDRYVHVTLNRLWNGLTNYQKLKIIFELLFGFTSMITTTKEQLQGALDEILVDKDVITSEIRKLGQKFPWIIESLINERDQYMILELYQTLEEIQSGDIVAIVGAGHVPGMQLQWELQSKRTILEAERLFQSIQLIVPQDISKNDLRKYADLMTKDYNKQ